MNEIVKGNLDFTFRKSIGLGISEAQAREYGEAIAEEYDRLINDLKTELLNKDTALRDMKSYEEKYRRIHREFFEFSQKKNGAAGGVLVEYKDPVEQDRLHAEYENRIAELQKRIESLQEQNETLKREHQEAISELTATNQQQKDDLQQAEKNNEELQQMVATIQEQKSALDNDHQKQIDDLAREHEAKIKNLLQDQDALESQLSEKTKENKGLEDKLKLVSDQLAETISERDTQKAEYSARIDELLTEREASDQIQNDRITENESLLREKETVIQRLRDELASLQEKSGDINQRYETLIKDIQEFQSIRQAQDEQISQQKQEVQKLRQEADAALSEAKRRAAQTEIDAVKLIAEKEQEFAEEKRIEREAFRNRMSEEEKEIRQEFEMLASVRDRIVLSLSDMRNHLQSADVMISDILRNSEISNDSASGSGSQNSGGGIRPARDDPDIPTNEAEEPDPERDHDNEKNQGEEEMEILSDEEVKLMPNDYSEYDDMLSGEAASLKQFAPVYEPEPEPVYEPGRNRAKELLSRFRVMDAVTAAT